MPQLVLLDIDGTLIDSNDAHARAWEIALREHGREVSYEAIRRSIGKGGDKLLPDVSGIDAESALGKALSEARGRIFKERFLPTLAAFPCAREAVLRMKQGGLRVGVATSAAKDELRALLDVAGVTDLVEGASSSDDADNSKPDPDIVQAALRKNRTAAKDALLLGDTPYDVTAGRRAGVGVVAVRTGGWSKEELAGALVVYADLRELLANWERSPFCSSVASMHH
jgi:phosphoglycolate phosphatase-like HAD superfamily hydrolase